MALVTVRVRPRAGRTSIEAGPAGVVARVRAAPEGGRATEEARVALADALRVPKARVRLRTGGRSRTKVFDVTGLSEEEVSNALRGR